MAQHQQAQKIAFLTGTSSGFGLLTSVALAKEGYRVIASMRNAGKQGRLQEAAEKAGVADRIEIVELDVTDFSAMDARIQEVIARYGKIDLLVNNAGYPAGGFVEEVAMEEWRRQFETNFFAVVALTRAVLPSMRERRSGTIINLSSIAGRMAFPTMGPYAASKFAVEGFSESLRLEMLPYGVRVVLIEPGSYKTDIWSKGLANVEMDPNSPYAAQMQAMASLVEQVAATAGDPDEVVQTILRAVRSSVPDLRYPVGKGVKGQIMAKALLPWKMIEQMVWKQLRAVRQNGRKEIP